MSDDSAEELIRKFKTDLSDKEMEILKRKFGVDLKGGTDEEILRAILEITQEKIEKIEREALKRLRGESE